MTTAKSPMRKGRDRVAACWQVARKLILPVGNGLTVAKLVRDLFER